MLCIDFMGGHAGVASPLSCSQSFMLAATLVGQVEVIVSSRGVTTSRTSRNPPLACAAAAQAMNCN